MPIDDEVRRVSDAVAARVREDVARELQAVLESRPVAPPPRPVAGHDSLLATEQIIQLVAGMHALSAATSLTEVLDTLSSAASNIAARVGVLLVDDAEGGRLRPWRMSGFGPQIDGQQAMVDRWEVLAASIMAREGCDGDVPGLPQFIVDGCLGKRVLVPIKIEGNVSAALYADQGWTGMGDTPGWGEALEALALEASRCLEVVTLRKTVELMSARPVKVAAEVRPPAGRVQEDPEAARRYARLLISEIKLYHEPQVLAGRKERDLASRLRSEIARARSLYQQRIPPALPKADEYFHAELVRTLANGDETLLGRAL